LNTLKDRFFRELRRSGDTNTFLKLSTLQELTTLIFSHQARNNPVYAGYLKRIGYHPGQVIVTEDIPFLPIELFKTHRVVTGTGRERHIFRSSGTTGSEPAQHYILDEKLYQESFTRGFQLFFGDPRSWCLLALLPSYVQQGNSSLVYMADHLIKLTGHPQSGFYLDNLDDLASALRSLESSGQKTLLFGVSFALLDFAEKHPMPLTHTRIIETGGMKGRRPEMTRTELHDTLSKAFGVKAIGSEYGMTELLSQAWSEAEGLFRTPPWMRIIIRDPYNPFRRLPTGKAGGIDIIDLANLHSCSFIQTGDLGRLHEDGSFEVLGRLDQSDIRGCNLLASAG